MNIINYKIKLAGIPIEINCLHKSTRNFCREYLTEDAPLFSVSCSQSDIDAERTRSAKENRREGTEVIDYSDAYLETLAVYRKISDRLPDFDAMLFHGSVICAEGKAYIFTAKSGTGKSTHARLWRKVYGDRVFMINDDKPILRFISAGSGLTAAGLSDEKDAKIPCAFGTPWDGKHHLSTNTFAPIGGICVLERAEENSIVPMSAADVFPRLTAQTYRPDDPAMTVRTLSLVSALSTGVPCWRLGCNMEDEAARVSFEAMVHSPGK